MDANVAVQPFMEPLWTLLSQPHEEPLGGHRCILVLPEDPRSLTVEGFQVVGTTEVKGRGWLTVCNVTVEALAVVKPK